ncbi:hypothetical protein BLNAU_2948 [Blattamonas nauphoetae]|uniref:Coilin n=1 Tax=Blattamonas nauphoetae TaxID=2049346 RepID=A0ABQ9YF26_9EUKA|nr:hypothetical protein BLNAU_2948 [Blattamonas nauphoetae]
MRIKCDLSAFPSILPSRQWFIISHPDSSIQELKAQLKYFFSITDDISIFIDGFSLNPKFTVSHCVLETDILQIVPSSLKASHVHLHQYSNHPTCSFSVHQPHLLTIQSSIPIHSHPLLKEEIIKTKRLFSSKKYIQKAYKLDKKGMKQKHKIDKKTAKSFRKQSISSSDSSSSSSKNSTSSSSKSSSSSSELTESSESSDSSDSSEENQVHTSNRPDPVLMRTSRQERNRRRNKIRNTRRKNIRKDRLRERKEKERDDIVKAYEQSQITNHQTGGQQRAVPLQSHHFYEDEEAPLLLQSHLAESQKEHVNFVPLSVWKVDFSGISTVEIPHAVPIPRSDADSKILSFFIPADKLPLLEEEEEEDGEDTETRTYTVNGANVVFVRRDFDKDRVVVGRRNTDDDSPLNPTQKRNKESIAKQNDERKRETEGATPPTQKKKNYTPSTSLAAFLSRLSDETNK